MLARLNRTQLLIAAAIGIGLGILVTVAVVIFALTSYQRVFVSTKEPTATTPASSPLPSPTPDPLAPFGVLLLGFGGPNHDGGYLSDTMIVAYVQPRVQKISLISLPRDLWVNLPITETEVKPFKINAAYAIGRDDRHYPHKPVAYTGPGGGGAMAKTVVSDVTGLPIKYFVAVSFEGFVKSIDVLGGVKIKVPVTFDDPFYPIEDKKADTCGISPEELAQRTATLSGQKLEQSFACRFEQLHFDAGTQVMDGATALKYARSRHSPQSGGDYARSARQKAMLVAVRDQVLSVGFLPKLVPFISKLTYDMQTDIELSTIQEWIANAAEYQQYAITQIEVTDKNAVRAAQSADRQYILEPTSGAFNWSSIHDYIQTQLQASPSATPSSR